MKKYLSIITMLLSFCAVYAQEEELHYNFEYEGIRYKVLSEEEHTVETVPFDRKLNTMPIPYDNLPDTVILAKTISYKEDEYTLVKIGNSSFAEVKIDKIVLPTTVRTIESEAFRQSKLAVIEGMDSVREFGFCAFGGSDIESIVFPDSIRTMDMHLFMLCHKLRRIEIPAISYPNNTLGANIFKNINPYEINIKAYIPPTGNIVNHYNWEKYIPKNTWIVVPSGSIDLYRSDNEWGRWGDKILPDNYALDTPVLFESDGLFFSKISDSDSLVSIVRPPKQFMEHPYGYGVGGTFTVPSKVTFQGKEYTVHAIGGFMDSEYEEIVLPPTVKVIDRLAFIHSKLRRINTEHITEIRQQAFHGSDLEEIKIPQNTLLSLDATFYDCQNLSKVDLPINMESIMDGNIDALQSKLFGNCTNLDTLICRSPAPFGIDGFWLASYDKIFEIENYIGEIYEHISPTVWVPKGAIDAYREAWGKYTDDFRELEEEQVAITEVNADEQVAVIVSDGTARISGIEGSAVTITSVSGRSVYSTANAPEQICIHLPRGIYLLTVNGKVVKFPV